MQPVDKDGLPDANDVKALGTTFMIIEVLVEREEARLTDIANYCDTSMSTVYKHLNTLRKHEFVVKEDKHYRLGYKFLDIGCVARLRHPGTGIIKEKIKELAKESEEAAQYMTMENYNSVVLYRETGRKGVPSRSRVGRRLGLHCTASGKAILSQMKQEVTISIIEECGLPLETEQTITDLDVLIEELDQIRETGIAYNFGESTRGLNSVGVPVSSKDNEVLGACVVTGPSHRFNEERIEEVIQDTLLSIVNEIELNIAHS